MSTSLNNAALQVQATGFDDDLLYGQPQLNFLEQDYKRIVNFCSYTLDLEFNEEANFGRLCTVKLQPYGDLLNRLYLKITLPALPQPPLGASVDEGTYLCWTQAIGFALIDYVELHIGGVPIDRWTGRSLEAYSYMRLSESKRTSIDNMVYRTDDPSVLNLNAVEPLDVYVPFPFWFCQKLSQSLPVLCFRGLEVILKIKFRDFSECINYDGLDPSMINERYDFATAMVMGEYLYTTQDYRESMVQVPKQILMTQNQSIEDIPIPVTGLNQPVQMRIELPFNFSVTEIVWFINTQEAIDNNDWFNYGQFTSSNIYNIGGPLMLSANITFDGRDRVPEQPESYYRLVVNNDYYSFGGTRNLYAYSFAQDPEKIQPSGSMQFSRFSKVFLNLTLIPNVPPGVVSVFATNYNFLTIDKDRNIGLQFMT